VCVFHIGDLSMDNEERERLLRISSVQSEDSGKTPSQDTEDRPEDTPKTSPRHPKRRSKDSTSVLRVSSEVSSPSVLSDSEDFQTEIDKLVPSRSARSDTLTEADLKLERERRGKIQVATEMLGVGWSVREVSQELKLPKSLIEKLSKKLSAEERPTGGYRQRYLERPYQKAMEQEENDEDTEGLLSSGWIEKIQRKIWKMKIEQSLMRKAGLIGDDGDEKRSGSDINLNQILIAKVVASGGQLTGKELIEFASSMKTLFTPQQSTADPIEIFEKLQNVQNQGVKNYKELEASVRANVASSENKGIIKEAIELAKPFLKNLAQPPSGIPEATASIPPPMQVTQSQLEALRLPTAEPLQGLPVAEALPDDVGYSNIQKPDISKKSALR